jgi:hypothetical protein
MSKIAAGKCGVEGLLNTGTLIDKSVHICTLIEGSGAVWTENKFCGPSHLELAQQQVVWEFGLINCWGYSMYILYIIC